MVPRFILDFLFLSYHLQRTSVFVYVGVFTGNNMIRSHYHCYRKINKNWFYRLKTIEESILTTDKRGKAPYFLPKSWCSKRYSSCVNSRKKIGKSFGTLKRCVNPSHFSAVWPNQVIIMTDTDENYHVQTSISTFLDKNSCDRIYRSVKSWQK